MKKNYSIRISVFDCENKEKHPIYVPKKCCEEKHIDLLLIGEAGMSRHVLVKVFDVFMYDHTLLHGGGKHSCHYCVQPFSTEEISKRHIKDCFKTNGMQMVIIPKNDKYVKFKNYERKIKSLFIIYIDFESILVPEDNGKNNPEESCTNKYKKHIACSYGCKLVCVMISLKHP